MTNEELIAEVRERAGYMTLLAKLTKNEPGAVIALEEAGRMTRVADALEAAEARIAELETERDAATAAVERVRAIHTPEVVGIHEGYGEEVWCPTCKHHYPCPTVAALDGAPEPEVKP